MTTEGVLIRGCAHSERQREERLLRQQQDRELRRHVRTIWRDRAAGKLADPSPECAGDVLQPPDYPLEVLEFDLIVTPRFTPRG